MYQLKNSFQRQIQTPRTCEYDLILKNNLCTCSLKYLKMRPLWINWVGPKFSDSVSLYDTQWQEHPLSDSHGALSPCGELPAHLSWKKHEEPQ